MSFWAAERLPGKSRMWKCVFFLCPSNTFSNASSPKKIAKEVKVLSVTKDTFNVFACCIFSAGSVVIRPPDLNQHPSSVIRHPLSVIRHRRAR